MTKILIAEKDIEMASLIGAELQGEGTEISTINCGRKLLQRIKNEQIQLLITALNLPEVSGLVLLEEVRKIKNADELAILILTDPMQDELLATAIEKGANDFLFKPYRRSHLLSHVRALCGRFIQGEEKQAIETGQYTLGKFRLNLHSSDFYQGDDRTHLTPSEFKLLEALFRHRGMVLTRDQLIEEVQGAGVVVIDRAIDTHVFSLRKKLGDFSDLIETVRGIGYRIRIE